MVELSSAAVVAWHFSARDPETRERTALRVIAWSFFALAAYVSVGSLRALFGSAEADHSTVGIVLASVSLLVMPFLSYAQRRTGRELGSLTAVADSKQTLLCTYLSAVLLVGLVVNGVFGWSWADPVAGLVIAAVALREDRWLEGQRLLRTNRDLTADAELPWLGASLDLQPGSKLGCAGEHQHDRRGRLDHPHRRSSLS